MSEGAIDNHVDNRSISEKRFFSPDCSMGGGEKQDLEMKGFYLYTGLFLIVAGSFILGCSVAGLVLNVV